MMNVSVETVTILGNIRILIEICLDVSVQFVSELISGYISVIFLFILVIFDCIQFNFWNFAIF